MNKLSRQEIAAKTNGLCAYCGQVLPKRFHIDHVKPILRNWTEDELSGAGRTRGSNEIDNLLAACPRCNLRKGQLSVQSFREELEAQTARLYRDSAAYRLALDYGEVIETGDGIRFYFETIGDYKPNEKEK